MKKIKISQLTAMKDCKRKAYFLQFNNKTTLSKSGMIAKVYKSILQEYDFTKLEKEQLQELILEKLDDRFFLTKQEKQVEIDIMTFNLMRYIAYEKQLNRSIVGKKINSNIEIGRSEINLNADLVFEATHTIEIVKFKINETNLSYKARTEKNLPENDIELFLLRKLGEKLYSDKNKPVISSYYHFKGKKDDTKIIENVIKDETKVKERLMKLMGELSYTNDKKAKKDIEKEVKAIKDILNFNNSEGNNIIQYNFNKDLSNEITDLLNEDLTFESEKCESSDCDFCSFSTLCKYKPNDIKLEIVKEVKKSSGDVKLTKEQEIVKNIEDGIHRINACCGTGKSTTMTLRVIELLKKGCKPKDILLITFTNKGCEELKEKIDYWTKYYKIKNVRKNSLNIYTFNSFGGKIISKEWEKLGFNKCPDIATSVDVNETLKELLDEYDKIEWLNYKNPLLNYPNAKGAFTQLSIYFDLIKSFGYDENSLILNVLSKEKDATDESSLSKSKLIFEIYDKFNQKLKDNNLLQYQDQILYLTELFEKYPKLIEKYGFSHVIVDEFQDTDISQMKLLHQLKEYKSLKSLMVVGDSSQAIYGFRNTTPDNIINFNKEFANSNDVFLLDNFRSTPQICEVANRLDRLNEKRIDKDIVSKKADGEIPQLFKFETLESEYKYISDLIEEKLQKGISHHEIACICRTKKELLEIQKYLDEKNIPNVIESSELYIENSNVQHILNLAKFFMNPESDYYLIEYLHIVNQCLSTMSLQEVKDSVQDLKDKIIKNLEELEDEKSKIEFFFEMIAPIIEYDIVAESFVDLIKNKPFYTFKNLLNHLYKVELYKDNTAIEKDDSKYNAIVLTTAHSSKGKEWSVVINSINSYKYADIKQNLNLLEEERRLLFVSITRAKDELYITYNTNENKTRNKGKYVLFADELDAIEKIEFE